MVLDIPEVGIEDVGQEECQVAREISVEEVEEANSKDDCINGRGWRIFHSRNT